ncbi:MAG: hypothetical protein H6624_05835 [Bdellovibrionaceae bacterium]|nr:hypothetical protein [Bdellovibrionales bacterium]MCB9083842.1 hypothetical protein [Pseudobdellovibrionaceae bacterium]
MAKNWGQLIQYMETASQAGRGDTVRKDLKSLNTSKVPRAYRSTLANLARRSGLPLIGIRLLNPIIRSDKPMDEKPRAEEISEYAVSLLNIGAVDEAQILLENLDSQKFPSVLLYRSFIRFSRWQYHLTLNDLATYCHLVEDPYQVQVGKVNWAAALVFAAEFAQAEGILSQLREELKQSEKWRLLGNALELSAQVALGLRQWVLAKSYLEQARSLLGQGEGLNDFFVRKWEALLQLHEQPQSVPARFLVHQLKDEAKRLYHWESVRDFDFYLATLGGDEELFLRVYFGTPHAIYREHILAKTKGRWQLPDNYRVQPIAGDCTSFPVWDLVEGKLVGGSKPRRVKPGQLFHRSLGLLGQDLYHPKPMATLFAELFPGEYFNPNTSPDRVYQVIRRLKAWLSRSKMGIAIGSRHGGYHLILRGPTGLLLRNCNTTQSAEEIFCSRLKQRCPEGFNSRQASEVLGISRTAFQRWLDWAHRERLLVRQSAGPHTNYKWLN